MGFSFDGQEDAALEDARRKVGKIAWVIVQERFDAFLKIYKVARVLAAWGIWNFSGKQNLSKFVVIFIGSDFRRKPQLIFLKCTAHVRLPYTGLDKTFSIYGVTILHILKAIIERTQQEHQGGNALLTVDNFRLSVVVFVGDDCAEVVLFLIVEVVLVVVGEGEVEEVIPQGLALIFAPSVGALVVGDEKVRFSMREEFVYAFLVNVELGHALFVVMRDGFFEDARDSRQVRRKLRVNRGIDGGVLGERGAFASSSKMATRST